MKYKVIKMGKMNGVFFRALSVNQRLSRMTLLVLTMLGVLGTVATAQGIPTSVQSAVQSTLCSVYKLIHGVIFLLGLALMVLGAALYAGANVAPSAPKGAIQGYGMGMIVGGVIGVIISILSPFLLGLLTGNTTITAGC